LNGAAEKLQIQPSYWSQIKSPRHQIGERLAKQFEQLFKSRRLGWTRRLTVAAANAASRKRFKAMPQTTTSASSSAGADVLPSPPAARHLSAAGSAG
jgi:hypothetical protein